MKVITPFALGLLVVVTGCVSHEKIVFSDEQDVRTAAATSAPAQPVQKILEKSDELEIEQMIFGSLLDRDFGDAQDYSAVFLQTDDSQVNAMIKKYPTHVPPIKQSHHALIQAHRTPLDKDTNKPAIILSIDVNEPNADDSVDGVGRWYAGDAVTGFHTFHLLKTDGHWQITDVK